MRRVVIGPRAAAAQHHVAVAVAARGEHRHLALAVDAQKPMRVRGGAQRVDGHAQAAVGAVLKAHRRGQAAGHFPMGLRFRGARADGGPGDQVLKVLRRDRIEGLGGGGQAQGHDIGEQAARQAQALFNAERVIQMGVVDQPLPAQRRARLFEVHAHDDIQRVLHLFRQRAQAPRVVHRRPGVVDRAGAHDDQQARIAGVENVENRLPARGYRGAQRRREGYGVPDLGGRRENVLGGDIDVVDSVAHGGDPALPRSMPAPV